MSLPNLPIAQPGKPPQVGQWAPYVYKDGSETAGLIIDVMNASPDGKWYNVVQVILKPAEYPGVPNGTESAAWLYEVATGQVLWYPSGGPFPS